MNMRVTRIRRPCLRRPTGPAPGSARASRRPAGRPRLAPLDAFTLLEVLLAVAVFAIVLTAMHTVFFAALRLRNTTTSALERNVPLDQAITILRRDLVNLVPPGTLFAGPLQSVATGQAQTNTSGGTQPLAASTPTPMGASAFPGLQSPTWYTATGVLTESQPWAEIHRVVYRLADPTNHTAGRDLFRSVTRNLVPVLQEETEDQWLLSGVESLFFSFYDGQTWRDTWDSTTEEPPLPEAIRVELYLAAQPGEVVLRPPVTLVVPILVQAATNSTSTTGS